MDDELIQTPMFLVRVVKAHGYFHPNATIALSPGKYGDEIDYPKEDRFYRFYELARLVISSQGEIGDPESRGVYAIRVGMEGSAYSDTASLERAEIMVKTLRKIDRGMVKLASRFGVADDYVTTLLRVADVLGIDRFLYPSSPSYREMSGCEYQTTDAAGVRWYLESQIADCRGKVAVL